MGINTNSISTVGSNSFAGATTIPHLTGSLYGTASWSETALLADNATNSATALFATTASFLSVAALPQLLQLNFANDAEAAAGGVVLGGLYRNGNVVAIRFI